MQVALTFDCRRPETHLVRVTQRFPATEDASRAFCMPAWVPGSYKIRDFGRHVQDFSAKVGGKAAQWSQPAKDRWVVAGTKGAEVELTFDAYCRELTVDTSHVTADHAHLFPATLMLYDEASRNLPHAVKVLAPPGWKLWSGLETEALRGDLRVAESFDHLVDCPIEVGPPGDYHVSGFDVRGIRHRLVLWRAPGDVDWRRLVRDVKAIVVEAGKVFGEHPYPHYTFLAHVAMDHGGGLEHRNSTVLGVDPLSLQSEDKIRTRFLPLVAHEFFHTWNVKRILPATFQPYQLQAEHYTGLLWLFEGFTSYYEMPILHRAKVVSPEDWGKMAGEDLEFYDKAVGRKRTSVAQASRLAWTLLYQPHEHNINRNVSYYTKGMWVALCLEAELRRRKVPGGLDAVMRHLWRRHGRTAQGVPEDAFPDLVLEATGIDLRRKLHAWIDGTVELPIDQAFATLGWTVKRDWKDPKKRLGFGLMFKGNPAHTVERIADDMPAWRVLQPDDELVALEGYRFRADRVGELAATRKAGDTLDVAVFREGRLRHFAVPLVELPKDKITITVRKGHAPSKRIRLAWLGEPRKDPKPKRGDPAARGTPRGRQNRY